jgi:Icc-related predicted phosphoesterase
MQTRIFFATDIHGSEKCWKKFINAAEFYRANILILGGDMTGKAIVPLIQRGPYYEASFLGKELVYPVDKVRELEEMILNKGYYPYRTNPEEFEDLNSDAKKRDHLFIKLMIETIRRWMKFADERLKRKDIKCFVCPGNDDMLDIDPIIEESKCVTHAEGRILQIDDHHEMISLGWTNPTPWNTFKECSEEELLKKIEKLASKIENINTSIFNLHAPPYGCGLDEAPEIDETLKVKSRVLVPVGSTAVREAIQKYQPLLGLHGHIHESRGFTKIGRTLCANPGSSYERGALLGVLINLDDQKIKSYIPLVG